MKRVLVVNCQSHIYKRLCKAVSASLDKAGIEYELLKRDHDNLKDIIDSELKNIDLVVFSGSTPYSDPSVPDVSDAVKLMEMTLEQDKYSLAVCFGLQMLAYVLDKRKLVEVGAWGTDVEINVLKKDPVLEGISGNFMTRQYHNYAVPHKDFEAAEILAASKDGVEIMRAGNMIATQFHPESKHASEDAIRVLDNFISYLRE